jgi:acetyl esterase/lipase
MNLKSSIFTLFFAVCFKMSNAQVTIPLYPGVIPNSKSTVDKETAETKDSILRIAFISRPTLTAYLPEKPNGAAVIICPGGGYWIEAAGHEGADVARKFNEAGITAFVLKYRIPDTATMINREIGPLQDAQRAIQIVRENAASYGIKKDKIGLMGFSAGGHLASTAGTHFNHNYIENAKHISLRPDFLILVYPVISFTDSIGHIGSRDQLIGKNPSQDKIKEYSNELQVTDQTPPSFLVQAKDDPVKVQNSIVFADALRKHNVPVEIYLYEKGGHGYGMNNKTSPVKWMDLAEAWMRKMKFM